MIHDKLPLKVQRIPIYEEDEKIRWKSLVSLSRGDSDITVFPSGSKIERFRGETGWKDSVSTVKVSRNDIIARRFSSVHLSSPPPPLPPSFAGSSTIWPWYFRISEWKTFATLSIRKEWTRIVIILISNQRFGIFSTRIVAVLRVIVISTFCVV